MPPKESLYPTDWLRIAEKDYARVGILLTAHDPGAAGFYLQQALEKFLKAFLLSRGWQLQRIHDLEPLLNEALKFDSSLVQYRTILQRITGSTSLNGILLFLTPPSPKRMFEKRFLKRMFLSIQFDQL